MNKVIVVKRNDGGVSIIVPASEMFDPASRTRNILRSQGIDFQSDEQVLEWIRQRDVPQVDGVPLSHRITDESNVPTDRTFRNAWTDDNPTDTVDIDITKAQEIHKDKLRELRKPLLEKLDVEFMRALETDDTQAQAEISSQKQELRDVTSLTLPENVEDLKAFIPDCLQE